MPIECPFREQVRYSRTETWLEFSLPEGLSESAIEAVLADGAEVWTPYRGATPEWWVRAFGRNPAVICARPPASGHIPRVEVREAGAMTRTKALAALAQLADRDDTETAHRLAGEVLCRLLTSLGYGDVAAAFERLEKTAREKTDDQASGLLPLWDG